MLPFAQFPTLHSIKCLSDVNACVLPLSWLAIRTMQHIPDQIGIIYLLLEWLFRHSSHLYLADVLMWSLFLDTLVFISVSKLASQISEMYYNQNILAMLNIDSKFKIT
jgi:hypothetical protein